MKKYSRDPDICNYMECPVMCNCGNFHELDDGYRKGGSNQLECPLCHQITELEEEIEDIKWNMECENTKKKEGKAAIKKLQERITKLQEEDGGEEIYRMG